MLGTAIWLVIDCFFIAWNLHTLKTGKAKGWELLYKFGTAFWVAMALIDAIQLAIGVK